jgi:hypothetical protein
MAHGQYTGKDTVHFVPMSTLTVRGRQGIGAVGAIAVIGPQTDSAGYSRNNYPC